MAKKCFFLVETAIFYGQPKLGLFSAQLSELETGPSDVIPGISPPFQAYLACFYILSHSSEKIYLISFYSHFYSTSMSSSDGSLASSSSEDTDIDVADYDLEVEGSLNSSAQGSDQEAEEASTGLLSLAD